MTASSPAATIAGSDASANSEFVKNGSVGHVTDVHQRTGEVTVAFEREGTITVPRGYLAAGRLEHGYARTSYGVQGATHGTGRYHPTDLSSFEEGYVAITRGRSDNHVYIVDGTITLHDDETHQTPAPAPFDLDDIGDALTNRRAGMMATDMADRLPDVHYLANTHTLAELSQARRRLGAALAQVPADQTQVIAEIGAEVDGLRSRRNLWTAAGDGAKSALAERALAGAERRLVTAHDKQRDRDAWLTDNAAVVDQYQLLRRAERHRRTRISENPGQYLPDEAVAGLGPEPVGQTRRRLWRATLVEHALAHDREAPQPADAAVADLDVGVG